MKLTTMKLLSLFLVGFFLVGCLSPQQIRENERRAQQQAQAQRIMEMNAIRNKCVEFGFKRETSEFAQCVQRESNRNDSCKASTAAINQRVSQCQSQCYMSLNTMECNNRCKQVYGTPPNC